MFNSAFFTICMNKKQIIHARTCVYNVHYHIVWSVKYRRKVLTREVEKDMKNIFQHTVLDKRFKVFMAEVGEQDHVHVFASASAHPKVAPSYIVKMLKGISARKLFLLHPQLKQQLSKGHLWNNSYIIETVGSISEDAIKTYIANQSKGGE
jgi:putative transposase